MNQKRYMPSTMGIFLYGAFFVLILPAMLVSWANSVPVSPPALLAPLPGVFLTALGACLWCGAVYQLWCQGRGLPMNAYPPPKAVRKGLYALVPHPLYVGAVIICAGVSLWLGSGVGLWLVTPLLIAGIYALVWGYERIDLRGRFRSDQLPDPWLSLPEKPPEKAATQIPLTRRVGIALSVLIPWVVMYQGVKMLGMPGQWFETRMSWEWSIPILSWSIVIYSSSYLVIPLAFLLPKSDAIIRRLTIQGWLSTAIVGVLYLCLPLTASFRAPAGSSFFDAWLIFEQTYCRPAAASWASFHVIWALFAAQTLASWRTGALWWTWGLLNILSALTTGMHSAADLLAGLLVWIILRDPQRLWTQMLKLTEHLANSWKAWRFGPLRLINHSLWPGLGGALGMLGLASLATTEALPWALFVGLCGLFGAAVIGQMLSTAPRLSRPFGYFGFVTGALAGLMVAAALSAPWAVVTGALCAVAPWVQALGRMRCIVQGCCHGKALDGGIRILNPHSRVICVSGMEGVPIHPTPLYSILYNLPLGLLLLRLWWLGVPVLFISGIYLILSGLGRFVEQAYRGEKQTPTLGGLLIYQWFAVALVLSGFVLSAIPSAPAPDPSPVGLGSICLAVAFGLLSAFAMSVDFPESSRRFARLSG